MPDSWRLPGESREICLLAPSLGGEAPGGERIDPVWASLEAPGWFADQENSRKDLVEIVNRLDAYVASYAASAPVSWLVSRVVDALRERRLEAYAVPVSSGGSGGTGRKTGQGASSPPPPPPPPEDRITWFEVAVVDPWGEPVGDVALEISWQGAKRKGQTGADGKLRVDDLPGSAGLPGQVRCTNGKAVRAAVRPRFGAKEIPDALPPVENPRKVAVRDEMTAISVSSETPVTLVLVRPLTRIRLLGMHFDTSKCFLRETAMRGIRRVVEVYKAIPDGTLLIVGHTDTSGTAAYNLDLSVERATAVKAYLQDDVAAWEEWFSSSKPPEKRWGNREVRTMIAALPCEQSVSGFQSWSNDTRGTSLVVDGDPGPKTRKAVIEAYMALEGTSLPSSIGAEIHGGGEYFPLADAGDAHGKDGVSAEEDRRVEIFCFDDEIHPPVPGEKAAEGEPEYDQWKKQVTEDVDVSATPSDEPLGKIWMEIWDKSGIEARAGAAYQISGDGHYHGTIDGSGRLLHESVPAGAYQIEVEGCDETSAALVLPMEDDEPQIRYLE